jgi:hypothetical protein
VGEAGGGVEGGEELDIFLTVYYSFSQYLILRGM